MGDFGYREGFCQMGSSKTSSGLEWVFLPRGDCVSPAAGTVEAWIATPTTFTQIVMVTSYEPSYVNRFPPRAAVRGGEACSFPDIEAAALIAQGIARSA